MKEEIFLKYENEKKFQNSLNTLDKKYEDAFTYFAKDVMGSRLRLTNCLGGIIEEVKEVKK